MSYFATVAFDIHEGTYDQYETVYREFEQIGLSRVLQASNGKSVHLPDTTTAGQFSGQTSAGVRDWLASQTETVFTRNHLHGRIFTAVGDGWAWGSRSP